MVLIFTAITVILMTVSVMCISNIKLKFTKLILWIMGIIIICIPLSIISEPISGVIIIISFTLLLYKSGVKLLLSISYTIFSMLILVLSDTIMNAIVSKIFINGKQMLDVIRDNLPQYLLFCSFTLILIYAISKLLGTIIHRKNKIKQFVVSKRMGVFIPISILVTFAFIYTSAFIRVGYNNSTLTAGMFIIYFAFLMIVMYVLFSSSIKEAKALAKQKEMEQLLQYTGNLEILNNDIRSFRHDYMNVLTSMMGFIEINDTSGLVNYINDEIIPFSDKIKTDNFKLGLLFYLKQPEIKGIVSYKVIQAQENGIKVLIDLTEDIEIKGMNIIDFCRVIGILLDNAIEAAAETEDRILRIAFVSKEDSTIIAIINSCPEDMLPVHMVLEKGFSTKGENRGLGLSNLKEIVDAYSNVIMDTTIENNEFKQIIEIINTN